MITQLAELQKDLDSSYTFSCIFPHNKIPECFSQLLIYYDSFPCHIVCAKSHYNQSIEDKLRLFSFFQVFKEHPLMSLYPSDHTPGPGLLQVDEHVFNQPNTALLSLVLMMGTFFVAFFLRKFRNSRFLGGKVPCFTESLKNFQFKQWMSGFSWAFTGYTVEQSHADIVCL